jgi:hypothetical protein
MRVSANFRTRETPVIVQIILQEIKQNETSSTRDLVSNVHLSRAIWHDDERREPDL